MGNRRIMYIHFLRIRFTTHSRPIVDDNRCFHSIGLCGGMLSYACSIQREQQWK